LIAHRNIAKRFSHIALYYQVSACHNSPAETLQNPTKLRKMAFKMWSFAESGAPDSQNSAYRPPEMMSYVGFLRS